MKQKSLFSIIYEDDKMLGIDKSSGLSVGGDRWDTSKDRLDHLLNSFFAEEQEKAASDIPPRLPFPHRVYTVHRIDQDTSGVVLFAKDADTHKELSVLFENGKPQKRYIAIVHGRPVWKETSCDLPLVPDGDKNHRTIIDKYQGKKSVTRFTFLGSAGHYSVIEALPETGRTHQIRVHLASLGHPIVCDPLYGKASTKGILLSSFKKRWQGDPIDERPLLARLGLHSAGITLPELSWLGGNELHIEAALPKDMAALIKQMEKHQKADFGI
ncbi:MAG: RluA family pseudouridine synthase [Treponema sp.]|jgi:23S rRNA pseudouridine1911/1915/1917 synthase|nr:RluA family pseudouridine synthase [Treponema sp.]